MSQTGGTGDGWSKVRTTGQTQFLLRRRKVMSSRTCCCKKLSLVVALFAMALVVFGLSQTAFAQFSSPGGGVDDSNGVFQFEGDAITTGFTCFGIGPIGPVEAIPGAGNTCPVVLDSKGNSATTNLVKFGGRTADRAQISRR